VRKKEKWLWAAALVFVGTTLGLMAQPKTPEASPMAPKYLNWLNDEVTIIISAKEKDVFLKLQTDKERDLFIASFWKQRDPNPATSENEFKTEHYRRLQYADQTYGTPTTPGRKTEAGQLYIVTGDTRGASLIFELRKALDSGITVQDASPWMMKMRIFEAARKGEGEPVKTVTSSYLKYSLTATIKSEFDLAEELKQIQKTFNYQDVKLLTEADFNWKKNDREKAFHIFRLDGLEYLVLISPVEVLRKLTFRIEVFEQGEKTKANLLDTEFAIPEKNITVFGFEDSKGNVYFLSFRVSGWTPVVGAQAAPTYTIPAEGPVRAIGEIKPPKLLKQVDPVYPEIARKSGITGIVIMEAETDISGHVIRTNILRSIPLLDQAAEDAVKQWVYEPMIINGKPRGIIFTVTVRFSPPGQEAQLGPAKEGESLRLTGGVAPPKLLVRVDPKYPEIARQAFVEGDVILEVTTDIYGRVQGYKILRSIPLLDKAAIDAVRQWVYEPVIINNKPIPVTFTVTVRFDLLTAEEAKKMAAEGEKLGPVKAEGKIDPPKLLKSVKPVYPEEARIKGIQGIVILEVETDVHGRVKRAKVLRSIPELDKAAMDTVYQWVYEPKVIDGKMRGVIFTATVRFQ
jgi:TonB family protein